MTDISINPVKDNGMAKTAEECFLEAYNQSNGTKVVEGPADIYSLAETSLGERKLHIEAETFFKEASARIYENDNVAPTILMKALNESFPEWKEWDSATELRAWLKQDDTDQQEYIVDKHDCDDFCIDLSMRAAEDGYYIGIRASDIYNRKWHMDNFAVIGNDVYKIEPQNDYCVKWDRLD